jgi:hypothetical protein
MEYDSKSNPRVACPCCGYPTLTERGAFEICDLCNWEDDGQDSSDADVVRGGPNGTYSLTAARRNFVKHLVMYDAVRGDGRVGGADSELTRRAKRAMMAAFDAMKATTDRGELDGLWASFLEQDAVLRAELQRRIEEYEAGSDPEGAV